MRLLIILVIVFTSTTLIQAQDMQPYFAYISKATEYYQNKDYTKSAENYQAAFDAMGGRGTPEDRYNAARIFALTEQTDKALFHLKYSAEHPRIKFRDLEKLNTDEAFKKLHQTKKWDEVIAIVKANKDAYEKYLDKPLAAQLERIYELDQKYRLQTEEMGRKYGFNSEEVLKLGGLIAENDAKNLIEVTKILDERGWLSSQVVGEIGSKAIFLVIQHADLETQLKYLPMMREAVKAGNAEPTNLALLEDRVLIRQGKQQIYGSQIGWQKETGQFYIEPISEPEKVNERRQSIGLPTLEEYLSQFNLTWDVEKHKESSKILNSKN